MLCSAAAAAAGCAVSVRACARSAAPASAAARVCAARSVSACPSGWQQGKKMQKVCPSRDCAPAARRAAAVRLSLTARLRCGHGSSTLSDCLCVSVRRCCGIVECVHVLGCVVHKRAHHATRFARENGFLRWISRRTKFSATRTVRENNRPVYQHFSFTPFSQS